MKRVIQRRLQNPLAEMILAGEIKDGDTITVSANDELIINGKELSAAAA